MRDADDTIAPRIPLEACDVRVGGIIGRPVGQWPVDFGKQAAAVDGGVGVGGGARERGGCFLGGGQLAVGVEGAVARLTALPLCLHVVAHVFDTEQLDDALDSVVEQRLVCGQGVGERFGLEERFEFGDDLRGEAEAGEGLGVGVAHAG